MTGVCAHSIKTLNLTADILQLQGHHVRDRCPEPDPIPLLCM